LPKEENDGVEEENNKDSSASSIVYEEKDLTYDVYTYKPNDLKIRFKKSDLLMPELILEGAKKRKNADSSEVDQVIMLSPPPKIQKLPPKSEINIPKIKEIPTSEYEDYPPLGKYEGSIKTTAQTNRQQLSSIKRTKSSEEKEAEKDNKEEDKSEVGRALVKEAYIGEVSRAIFPLTDEFAKTSNNSFVGIHKTARVIKDVEGYDGPYYECSSKVKSELCVPILTSAGAVVGTVLGGSGTSDDKETQENRVTPEKPSPPESALVDDRMVEAYLREQYAVSPKPAV